MSTPTYDLAKAVGHELSSAPVGWTRRDLLLYAIGIGARSNDFPFVYELDKNFSAFPTYPVVLSLKGDGQDVNDFGKVVSGGKPVPGLPKFDPNRVVHGNMMTEVLRPLPVESGPGWKLKRKVVGVHENKSGIIVEMELLLVDANDTPYTRMITSSFNVGAKAVGKFSKTIAKNPVAKPPPKDRKPDHVALEKTTEEQAILYRLSGDYNPLHIDPAIGSRLGFGGVILHGLATYGFAARAVLSKVGGNQPDALKLFSVRFTSPVKPGDTLETSMWEVGPGPDGTTEVSFVTKNVDTGKIVLGSGIAYVKKVEKSKL
jgi:acyl dehydratase